MHALKKIENFQVTSIKIILFIIAFLPLYVSPTLVFPFVSGKNFAFRILIELAAALWISLIIFRREYRFSNSIILSAVLFFTFMIGLADLFGVSPYNSFWSNYERMEGYITILHLAMYFLILKSIFRTQKDWTLLLNIVFAAGVIVGVLALFISFSEADSRGNIPLSRYLMEYGLRPGGTVGNPPFLASYLVCSVFLGIILFFRARTMLARFIYLAFCLVNSLVIYYTATRGAILAGSLGVVLVLTFTAMNRSSISYKTLIKAIALSVLGMIIFLTVSYVAVDSGKINQKENTLARFAAISSSVSVKSRLTAWKMAWSAFKENPFLGWGQENFISIYTKNYIPYVREQQWLDRAHNIIIHWLITAGILGLAAYLLLYGAAFLVAWRSHQRDLISKSSLAAIVIMLFVYFVQNLFTFDTINTYIVFFMILAYIDHFDASNIKNYSSIQAHENKETILFKPLCAILSALLAFSFVVYYINYRPIKQSQLSLTISLNINKYNSFSILLNDFNRALSYRTFGDSDVRERMLTISKRLLKSNQLARQGVAAFLIKTAEEWNRGIGRNLHNLEYLTEVIKYYHLLSTFNSNYINYLDSLIQKSININPQYEWLYMAQADLYTLRKEYERAYENIKRIADKDLNNDKKQFKLLLSAILASKEETLGELFEDIKNIRYSENINVANGKESLFSADELLQIASVYHERKSYPEALRYYNELTKIINDDNKIHSLRDYLLRIPQQTALIYFRIAQVYLHLDDKENALMAARKAAELDPQNFSVTTEAGID